MQSSGFDKPEYLYGITELQLEQLEEYINQRKNILANIECSHKEIYQNSQNFKLLPGHRTLILNLSKRPPQTDTNQAIEHPAFSILLQNLIQTALNNYEKPASYNRYSELLMDFAIYIYIMAGKACYEVIAANLPIPSVVTICNINFLNSWLM